jgi:hypothetical protein
VNDETADSAVTDADVAAATQDEIGEVKPLRRSDHLGKSVGIRSMVVKIRRPAYAQRRETPKRFIPGDICADFIRQGCEQGFSIQHGAFLHRGIGQKLSVKRFKSTGNSVSRGVN